MVTLPTLDARAGVHFTFRQICECGETWRRTRIENRPEVLATYDAIEALCRLVLDPVVEEFGPLELTYGFASSALSRAIGRRIAPRLDQHAGHELAPSGKPICSRLGQAVDFRIAGVPSLTTARFIADHTPFDRLYVYDDDRPVHVSYGPDHARSVVWMVDVGGRRIPRRRSLDAPTGA